MDSIREGNRGGRGLFTWENVRVMPYKDRQCYLGSTVSLGYLDKGGRWRKKDWWTKKQDQLQKPSEQQRQKVKQDDLNSIKQALGILKPKKQEIKHPLSTEEIRELFLKKSDNTSQHRGLGYAKPKKQHYKQTRVQSYKKHHKAHQSHKRKNRFRSNHF